MKKNKIRIILCMFLMASISIYSCCFTGGQDQRKEIKNGDFEYSGGVWSSMEYKIEERTIDSCQYIVIFGVDGRNIIHKANCRNPFHLYH